MTELVQQPFSLGNPHDQQTLELNRIREKEEAETLRYYFQQIQSGEINEAQFIETILSERRKFRKKISDLEAKSDYDPNLEGILSPKGLVARGELLVAQLVRDSQDTSDVNAAAFFLDLDGFKLVNDTYDHATGDRVIAAFATYLQQCAQRPLDLIARKGGDEFILLLELTKQGALHIAERIFTTVRKGFDNDFPNLIWPKTVSIGVQTIPTREQLRQSGITDTEQHRLFGSETSRLTLLSGLFEDADKAMYAAKETAGHIVFATYDKNDTGVDIFELPFKEPSGQTSYKRFEYKQKPRPRLI